MTSSGGRKASDVTQYLNQAKTPIEESFSAPLDLFTNSLFYDGDSTEITDFQGPPAKSDTDPTQSIDDGVMPSSPISADLSSMLAGMPDFSMDFYGNNTIRFPDNLGVPGLSQQQPMFVPAPAQDLQNSFLSSTSPRSTDKRKTVVNQQNQARSLSIDEKARLAAEEDKRRRNTAASARFRVKKKLREQALEKSAKELKEQVGMLSAKIQQLETENKWLKNILLEKNGGSEQAAALIEKGLSKEAVEKNQDSDISGVRA